jgi:hypothetical protein
MESFGPAARPGCTGIARPWSSAATLWKNMYGLASADQVRLGRQISRIAFAETNEAQLCPITTRDLLTAIGLKVEPIGGARPSQWGTLPLQERTNVQTANVAFRSKAHALRH